jgi:predicted enzyme related to lactoylglutathione lyase
MNLNQITIPSLDLSSSVSFYQALGLRLIVDALPRYARFECPDGNSTFSIHLAEQLPTGDGITVYFECDDIDTKVQQLTAAGIIFETQPTDQPWLWKEARLKDPDNNQLILFYAGENRVNPLWRIS